VVAVIGNAAEHSSAVLMAMKNKMDLAINIAIRSSIQVALFVAPVLVFLSYAFGSPMDLRFTPFEVLAVAMAVGVVNMVAQDGESHWMEGSFCWRFTWLLALRSTFFPHKALTQQRFRKSRRRVRPGCFAAFSGPYIPCWY